MPAQRSPDGPKHRVRTWADEMSGKGVTARIAPSSKRARPERSVPSHRPPAGSTASDSRRSLGRPGWLVWVTSSKRTPSKRARPPKVEIHR